MERKLILTARTLSLLFNPFYLPLMGLILLFMFSYLSMLHWAYKLQIMLLVYFFTILLPTLLIRTYNNYNEKKIFKLIRRERRMVPYIISIVCYFVAYYILNLFNVTYVLLSILIVALLIQLLCAIINVWWKVSTHAAGMGGLTGGVVIFSFVFGFYLLWWLSLVLILSGLVGSSRMILRQHTLGQVIGGYAIGFFSTAILLIVI